MNKGAARSDSESLSWRATIPHKKSWRMRDPAANRTARGARRLSEGYRGEVWLPGRAPSGAEEADRSSPVSGFGSPLTGAQFKSARRPHEVDRSEAGSGLQLAFPSELEASIKAEATVSFGRVCVCVFVAPVQ